MTKVFHARSYGGFIEIQSNLRRKKLHRINQGPMFLETVLATDNVKAPIKFKRERQTQLLINLFCLELVGFTSLA